MEQGTQVGRGGKGSVKCGKLKDITGRPAESVCDAERNIHLTASRK